MRGFELENYLSHCRNVNKISLKILSQHFIRHIWNIFNLAIKSYAESEAFATKRNQHLEVIISLYRIIVILEKIQLQLLGGLNTRNPSIKRFYIWLVKVLDDLFLVLTVTVSWYGWYVMSLIA